MGEEPTNNSSTEPTDNNSSRTTLPSSVNELIDSFNDGNYKKIENGNEVYDTANGRVKIVNHNYADQLLNTDQPQETIDMAEDVTKPKDERLPEGFTQTRGKYKNKGANSPSLPINDGYKKVTDDNAYRDPSRRKDWSLGPISADKDLQNFLKSQDSYVISKESQKRQEDLRHFRDQNNLEYGESIPQSSHTQQQEETIPSEESQKRQEDLKRFRDQTNLGYEESISQIFPTQQPKTEIQDNNIIKEVVPQDNSLDIQHKEEITTEQNQLTEDLKKTPPLTTTEAIEERRNQMIQQGPITATEKMQNALKEQDQLAEDLKKIAPEKTKQSSIYNYKGENLDHSTDVIYPNSEPEENISPEDINNILSEAKLFDAIVTESGEVFVKMEKISWGQHGEQQKDVVWQNLNDIINLHYPGMQWENMWEQKQGSPLWKYVIDGEMPKLGPNNQLTEEELTQILIQKGIKGYEKTTINVDINSNIENNIIVVGNPEIPEPVKALVGTLSPEEENDYIEAGKSLKDFFASVKRSFTKSGGWKRLISSVGASALGAAAITGAGAIVAAPAVAIGVAGIMAVSGVGYMIKANRMVKSLGYSSFKDAWRDKNSRRGIIEGLITSGSTKGIGAILAFSNPFLGFAAPVVGLAIETGIHTATEIKLNKERENLLNSYLTEYSRRKYSDVINNNYTIIRPDGNSILNVQKILDDARVEDPAQKGLKLTATKVGISTLRYLAEKTNNLDNGFNLNYTVTTNQGTEEKTANILDPNFSVHQLNLTGIEQESIESLLLNIEQTWNNLPEDLREDATKYVVSQYAEIETMDVEKILSSEKEAYINDVKRITTMRASMMFVNGLTAVVSGGIRIGHAAFTPDKYEIPVETKKEYSQRFNDRDADFVEATENGKPIVGADLDKDGDTDIWYKDGQYYPETDEGLRKVFELKNGIEVQEIHNVTPSSNSNVTGVLMDMNGNAVGIRYEDVNGNMGVLSNNELGGALTIDGQNVVVNNLDNAGMANVSFNGNTYDVDLTNLSDIPGSTQTTISDPLDIDINTGDSMNRAVQNLVGKLNSQYGTNIDPIQAEREIAMGLGEKGMLADQELRGGAGNGGVLDPGDVVAFRSSESTMDILERLNTGNPIPPSSSSTISSSGLPVGLTTANIDTVNPIPIDISTGEEVGVLGIFATLLGLGGLAMKNQGHNLTNQYEVNVQENTSTQPQPANPAQPTTPQQPTNNERLNPQPQLGTSTTTNNNQQPEINTTTAISFLEKFESFNNELQDKISKGLPLTTDETTQLRDTFINPQTGQWDDYKALLRLYHPDLNNNNGETAILLNNIHNILFPPNGGGSRNTINL